MPHSQLNRQTLADLHPGEARVVDRMADLKEKILQFGSGRFLRTFVGDFVDNANRREIFNGRIVVVQSTSHDTVQLLRRQDGLYTIWLEGLDSGRPVERHRVVSAVSRALAADRDWAGILAVARSEDLELIVSNTTEVGIAFDGEDQRDARPPRSFPGKLAALLYERYRHFSGSPGAGLTIIPCELITDNGLRLREIVLRLARRWGLEPGFSEWLEESNRFSNSLVDRIVTGRPAAGRIEQYWSRLGYRDELLSVGEPYALWAIEGDLSLREFLAFPGDQKEVIVEPDITPYRERKIRILNGAHTTSAAPAFLSGCDSILQMMEDSRLSAFVEALMRREIAPGLDLDALATEDFVDQVLDRFRNPFLRHRLLDITFQSTSKMRLRVLPSILRYHEQTGGLPPRLILGFAYYLLFMRAVERKETTFLGNRNGQPYPIHDDEAAYFYELWREGDDAGGSDLHGLVTRVCGEDRLWGQDLTLLPGFVEGVVEALRKPEQQIESLAG